MAGYYCVVVRQEWRGGKRICSGWHHSVYVPGTHHPVAAAWDVLRTLPDSEPGDLARLELRSEDGEETCGTCLFVRGRRSWGYATPAPEGVTLDEHCARLVAQQAVDAERARYAEEGEDVFALLRGGEEVG